MSNIFFDSVKKDNVSKDDGYISLNDTGDLTRMAYSNKSSDIPLRNSSLTDRFESDTFINNKERPPSLYYRIDNDKNMCISSEPIDYENGWKFVPKNSIGYIVGNKINISKINI